jgi:hypothetical protein
VAPPSTRQMGAGKSVPWSDREIRKLDRHLAHPCAPQAKSPTTKKYQVLNL